MSRFFYFFFLLSNSIALAQTGLQKSLISNGGGRSTGMDKLVQISIAQSVVGKTGSGTTEAQIGFWNVSVTPVQDIVEANVRSQTIYPEFSQNYPNPFKNETQFDLYLPVKEMVRIYVYNIKGMLAEVLVHEELESGTYTILWNASDLMEGNYICELQVGDYKITRSLILIR